MVVAQGVLPFKVKLIDAGETVTAHGALPLVVEALRRLVPEASYRALAAALRYASLTPVRRHLQSLVALLDFPLSSPTQAKDFLYRFHQGADGHPLTEAEDTALSVRGTATIRPEGPGLTALAAGVDRLVAAVQQTRPGSTATLDVDARIVEAHKVEALKAYEGTAGYQPQMAYWEEAGVWVLILFRRQRTRGLWCQGFFGTRLRGASGGDRPARSAGGHGVLRRARPDAGRHARHPLCRFGGHDNGPGVRDDRLARGGVAVLPPPGRWQDGRRGAPVGRGGLRTELGAQPPKARPGPPLPGDLRPFPPDRARPRRARSGATLPWSPTRRATEKLSCAGSAASKAPWNTATGW